MYFSSYMITNRFIIVITMCSTILNSTCIYSNYQHVMRTLSASYCIHPVAMEAYSCSCTNLQIIVYELNCQIKCWQFVACDMIVSAVI